MLAIRDPANGHLLESVAEAGEGEVDAAVRAADVAFRGPWRTISSRDRAQLLQRIADRVRTDCEGLARLESRNAGKPIGSARGEIGAVASCFEYYAGAVNKVTGQTVPVAARGTGLTFREPI